MYPEPTMIQNRYTSSIIVVTSDEDNDSFTTESTYEDNDVDSYTESDDEDNDVDSCTESDSPSLGPQNQLGLEPGEQFGSRWDDQVVALDEKGDIKYYEAIAKY